MNEILTHRLFRDDIADGILELVEKQPGITTGEIEKQLAFQTRGHATGCYRSKQRS